MTRAPLRRLRDAGLLAVLLAAACASPELAPLPAPEPVPTPDPAEVVHVLFLVGDPGEALAGRSPTLTRIARDIEWWASRLPADSSLTMIVLGDIVYPTGLHAPGTPEFPGDSAILQGQVDLVAGPAARARGARALFLPGNHDWGLRRDREGFARLAHLDAFLTHVRESGHADVRLVPEAGTGGPFVTDIEHARLILLDTAWWLLHGDAEARREVLEGVEEAMRTAADRHVLIAAHHPFRTGGVHGGVRPVWRYLGIPYLLSRSGAVLQDITSRPYRQAERGLRSIFARVGPPLAFIGGHEHSLQVLDAVQPSDARHSLTSGSASNLSGVTTIAGTRFARAAPGYMRLLIERDGGVSLFVEAAPPEWEVCPGEDPERAACVQEGVAAFETVYSQRLR